MFLIIPLIIGTIVGVLMAIGFERHQYIIHNIIYGILGALIFRIIIFVTVNSTDNNGISFLGIFASLVGAALFCYVTKFFPPLEPRNKDE